LAPSLADADADVDALAEDNNADCYRRIRVALREMEKPTHKHAKTSGRRAGAYSPQLAEQLANSNFVSEMAAPSTVLMSYPHPALNS